MRSKAFSTLRRLALAGTALAAFTPAHAEPVNVRGADHEGYSRIVFDWPSVVPYEVEEAQGALALRFQSADDPDLTNVAFTNLSRINGGGVLREGDTVAVRLWLSGEATLRHFRSGSKIVVDVVSAEVATAAPTPVVDESALPSQQNTAAPLQKAVEQMNAADLARAEEAAARRALERQVSVEAARRVLQQNFEEDKVPQWSVTATLGADYLRLDFPAPQNAAFAAFRRGDWLWVVLPGVAAVEHPKFEGEVAKRISDAEQVENAQAVFLRYRLVGDQFIDAKKNETGWSVYLRDGLIRPTAPIQPVKHLDPVAGPKLFLNIGDKAKTYELRDPDVGDRLVVFPSAKQGQGLSEPQDYADFALLQSAQGAALVTISESVEIMPVQGGVAIASSAGLGVLNAANQIEAREDSDEPTRFLDFESWRRLGGEGTDKDREKALIYALSMADEDDLNEYRWALARHYLAHGRSADASGILDVMAEDDSDLVKSPDFRAVRGVARLNLRRYALAREDLSAPELNGEADAALWRTLVFDALGKNEEALAAYQEGVPALAAYNVDDRARFALAAGRAALALGQNTFVEREVAALRAIDLSPLRRAEAQLLQARLSQVYKDLSSAREAYRLLAETAPRPIAAKARFEDIKMQLADGSMTHRDAIDAIEAMRYAWRGDIFELELLERLGQLYVAEGAYRQGLETLRQAANYFKASDKIKAIARQMEAIFQDLFLGGKADQLEPLPAVALYYDFQELTPLGADGDRMVRRLVDRMVSVDLLDRAAGLLEHQVKFRLEGVAQASVASRLAVIQIMDNKPELALDVIRATRIVEQMPDDLRRQRNQLEARALIDLGRFDEAEAILEDDTSPEAATLRADLYWGAKRWDAIIRNSGGVLGERWQSEDPLSMDERRQILRTAVAMTMTDREAELRVLRRRYEDAMANGPLGDAFDVITGNASLDPANLRAAVSSLADVDRLESFMANYRQAYELGGQTS